jgi:hypothetical protein
VVLSWVLDVCTLWTQGANKKYASTLLLTGDVSDLHSKKTGSVDARKANKRKTDKDRSADGPGGSPFKRGISHREKVSIAVVAQNEELALARSDDITFSIIQAGLDSLNAQLIPRSMLVIHARCS